MQIVYCTVGSEAHREVRSRLDMSPSRQLGIVITNVPWACGIPIEGKIGWKRRALARRSMDFLRWGF